MDNINDLVGNAAKRLMSQADGKKEKKPLRAEWLVHELTDAGEEV